jgi:hypothetical protein
LRRGLSADDDSESLSWIGDAGGYSCLGYDGCHRIEPAKMKWANFQAQQATAEAEGKQRPFAVLVEMKTVDDGGKDRVTEQRPAIWLVKGPCTASYFQNVMVLTATAGLDIMRHSHDR